MLYKEKKRKNAYKKRKNENFEKKNAFRSHVPRITQPQKVLGQKVCPIYLVNGRTDGHTDRVTTVGNLSGFQEFFLQPIIKDRPKKLEATPRGKT